MSNILNLSFGWRVFTRILNIYARIKTILVFIVPLSFDVLLLCSADSSPEETGRLPYKFALEPTLPEMVIFSIDELLWPFQVDKVMIPPLRATREKYQIRDRMGKIYELCNDTVPILDDLFTHWYKVGGMIQSTDPEKIENLMNLFDIEKYFKIFEVFPRTPGCKVKHIKRLTERIDIPLEDVLYFDTNKDDLEEVKALGVLTVYVNPKQGITYKDVEKGFEMYYYTKNNTIPNHYKGVLTVTARCGDDLPF